MRVGLQGVSETRETVGCKPRPEKGRGCHPRQLRAGMGRISNSKAPSQKMIDLVEDEEECSARRLLFV